MSDVSRCSLADDYKRHQKLFPLLPFLKKYYAEIQFLRKYSHDEAIYVDDKGRLAWYWEYDSDYGGNSGLMPFCYSEEEAGETWSFSELKGLVSNILNIGWSDAFIFPENIKSDRDLLEFVKLQRLAL